MQRHAASDLASTSTAFSRTFASLPEDIAEAARRARFPARRPGSSSWRAAAAAEEAAARAAALESAASVQQEGAKIGAPWGCAHVVFLVCSAKNGACCMHTQTAHRTA